jgi:uncharacterized protein (TIGR02421 family)
MTKQRQSLTPHQQTIHDLSERIVKAQRPIRILDALKWGSEIREDFFKNHFKKLPAIDANYYATKNPLPYNPEEKKEEFYSIERDIRSQLGQFSGVGTIMTRLCREYREVIRMLQKRGTAEFSKISQELYGGSDDAFYSGAPTLNDLAILITQILSNIQDKVISEDDEKRFTSEETVKILNERLKVYFHNEGQTALVRLSDGILADSAAGAEYIKIRKGAMFSAREIRAFETHEGWVHLGTTLNGLAQPVCTFLSKGAPSSTQAQEGLATVMEIFTFSSYPGRVRRLTDRITAIHMAEHGANFIDVFNYYKDRHFDDDASYTNASRVFRGSAPDKGPFTKDLTYSRGFVFVYNYIRLAIQKGLLEQIPLLFVGKVTLPDLHILHDLVQENIVVPPKFVPPQFRDLAALSAWMCYTLFLNRLNLQQMALDYKQILQE